ncbi:nucleolin-like isoform X1 [Varroa jacobsoni]|uniref:nucleolin-like isoform X1 n=2 Tax=Varroa jacobsoni TaxID=62625 RepID=UPI000BF41C69|nr:nucleolin-like isoform X1 [Varroa jacobsoni]
MAMKKVVAKPAGGSANKGVPAMVGKKTNVQNSNPQMENENESDEDEELKLQKSLFEKIKKAAEPEGSDEEDEDEADEDLDEEENDAEENNGDNLDAKIIGALKTKVVARGRGAKEGKSGRSAVESNDDEEEKEDDHDHDDENQKDDDNDGKEEEQERDDDNKFERKVIDKKGIHSQLLFKHLEAMPGKVRGGDDDDGEMAGMGEDDDEDEEISDEEERPMEMPSKEQKKGNSMEYGKKAGGGIKRKTLLDQADDDVGGVSTKRTPVQKRAKKTKFATSDEDENEDEKEENEEEDDDDDDDDIVLPVKPATQKDRAKKIVDGKQIDEKLDQLFNTYKTTPEEVEQFKNNYLVMVSTWLFVPHVPDDATEEEIAATHPNISKVKLPRKRKEGKNFAFLNFISKEKAEEALNDLTLSSPTIKGSELTVQRSRATGITPPEYINRRKLSIIACPKETTQEELCKLFPQATTVWLSKNPRSDTVENYLMFPDETICKQVLNDNGTVTLHGKCCAVFFDNYTYKKKTASRKLKKKFESGKHISVDRISVDAPKKGRRGGGGGSFRGDFRNGVPRGAGGGEGGAGRFRFRRGGRNFKSHRAGDYDNKRDDDRPRDRNRQSFREANRHGVCEGKGFRRGFNNRGGFREHDRNHRESDGFRGERVSGAGSRSGKSGGFRGGRSGGGDGRGFRGGVRGGGSRYSSSGGAGFRGGRLGNSHSSRRDD